MNCMVGLFFDNWSSVFLVYEVNFPEFSEEAVWTAFQKDWCTGILSRNVFCAFEIVTTFSSMSIEYGSSSTDYEYRHGWTQEILNLWIICCTVTDLQASCRRWRFRWRNVSSHCKTFSKHLLIRLSDVSLLSLIHPMLVHVVENLAGAPNLSVLDAFPFQHVRNEIEKYISINSVMKKTCLS